MGFNRMLFRRRQALSLSAAGASLIASLPPLSVVQGVPIASTDLTSYITGAGVTLSMPVIPAGCAFDGTNLTGTPTTIGTTAYAVEATDGTDTQTVYLAISVAAWSLTTNVPPLIGEARVGTPLNADAEAGDFSANTVISTVVQSFKLDGVTVAVDYVPTEADDGLAVTADTVVSDAYGNSSTIAAPAVNVIKEVPVIATIPPFDLVVDVAMNPVDIVATYLSGGTGTVSFDNLPAGLTFDGTTLSGTPTSTGNWTYTLSVVNSGVQFAVTQLISFVVAVAPSTAPAKFQQAEYAPGSAANGTDLLVVVSGLPDNGGSSITKLEVELDASGTWIDLGGVTTGTYTIPDVLSHGVTANVLIRATNSIGIGPANDTAKPATGIDTTAPVISSTTYNNGSNTLSFDIDDDGDLLVVVNATAVSLTGDQQNQGGQIETALATSLWSDTIAATTSGGSTPLAPTGLTDGTDYTIQIVLRDVGGNFSAVFSSVFTASVAAAVPSQITAGMWDVVDNNDGTVRFTFSSLPADNGAAITDIVYNIDGGSFATVGGASTGVGYDVAVADGASQAFRVRAVNSVGQSVSSPAKTIDVLAATGPTYGRSVGVSLSNKGTAVPSGAAGVYPQTGWVNITGTAAASSDLLDSTGTATGIGFTMSNAKGQNASPLTGTGVIAELLSGGLIIDNSAATILSLTALFAKYDLHLYIAQHGGLSGGGVETSITDGTTAKWVEGSNSAVVHDTLLEITAANATEANTSPNSAENNFVSYLGLTSAAQAINMMRNGGNLNHSLAAFQIVERTD